MKCFCLAAACVVLIGGCGSSSPPASNTTARAAAADEYSYPPRFVATAPGNVNSKPPRLTVGVSSPDTQLILPWFLNDIIDLINYR